MQPSAVIPISKRRKLANSVMLSYSPSYSGQGKYTTRVPLSPHDEWFEQLIGKIRKVQFLLNQHKDNPEVQQIFDTLKDSLQEGNEAQSFHMGKQAAQRFFVEKILTDYAEEIKQLPVHHIAVHYNDSEVLVWAVINDDDWETEKALIMAEARINAKYRQYGFHMSSLYMEMSDNYPMPSHYKILK